MSRQEDFTFEQKYRIIKNTFYKYQLLCPLYGIIKCPSCYCKMALGFECKKNGDLYFGSQSYQTIHIELGFRPVPISYESISRIHIDHIIPCYQGGIASDENGVMICEGCNLIFREFLTRDDKLFLLNSDISMMDCDNIEYHSNNSHFKMVDNGRLIFSGKDIIRSILVKRDLNKNELDVIPMYD